MGPRETLWARIILGAVGVLILFVGVLFLIAAVFEATRLLVGTAMILIACACFYAAAKVIKTPATSEDIENLILTLARRKNGRVTIAEVAVELGVPTKQASDILGKLSVKSPDVCTMDLDKDGTTEIYRFPAFEPKKQAKN